jgi:hypothetical protein
VDAAIPEGLAAPDERHHPPAEGRFWGESWYFDFATRDGSLGGYVRLGLYPNQSACWYWACVVGEGRRLVTVIDHEVAPPKPPSLELRGDGLWADHTIEVPFDHVTLGCEAFALGLDDPAEAYGPMVGERVPFGLDLEWETDGAAYPYPGGVTRYEVPCRVHGEVLVGDERIELDAIGQRDHSWGERDWWTVSWTWTAGWLEDGTRFHGTALRHGDDVVPYHPGYVQPPGGPLEPVDRTAATAETGDTAGTAGTAGGPPRMGMPTAGTVTVGDLRLDVEPVAFAPVLLVAPDGRESRFPRALCRFREPATGRQGVGWTEWNQPQPS